MGKKSLIKSTTKKTKAKVADKEAETSKKTTTPKTAKTKGKTTSKKAPAKSRKTSAPKKVKNLVLKKFSGWAKPKVFKAPKTKRTRTTAPPFVKGKTGAETRRMRKLLFNAYSMEQLKEAARKKAEAEKKAAEEAARKKAEAERKAAEEAARKKAEAEKKAAEEAARKKAEAERKAAEEAARKKAEAELKKQAAAPKDDPVKVSYTNAPKPQRKEKDPVENAMKIFIAALAFLILLVIVASVKNSGKYYLKTQAGAIEIFKGKFAPMGRDHFITLPGVTLAGDPAAKVFSRRQVYPLIFDYYLEKADNLLDTEGLPDFESIKGYLEKALAFATDNQMKSNVYRRIDNIDRIVMMYKAEVAIAKDEPESLETALDWLQKAKTLAADQDQKALIANKIKQVKNRLKEQQAALEAGAQMQQQTENTSAQQQQAATETKPEAQEPTAGH